VTLAARPRGSRSRLGVLGEIADRRRSDLRPELAALDREDLRRRVAAAPPPREIALRLAQPGLHLIGELKRS